MTKIKSTSTVTIARPDTSSAGPRIKGLTDDQLNADELAMLETLRAIGEPAPVEVIATAGWGRDNRQGRYRVGNAARRLIRARLIKRVARGWYALALVLLMAITGCVADDTIDTGPDATEAEPDAGHDPRIEAALGGWSIAMDLSACEVADRSVAFALNLDGARVSVTDIAPTDYLATKSELEPFGGRVILVFPDSVWDITLRDDGTNARALVLWAGETPTLGRCEVRDEATVTARVR